MGAGDARTDFHWSYTDEPHATRRKQILAKYPQVKELFGYDPNTKFIVPFWVFLQLTAMYLLHQQSWPVIILAAYCFGAFVTHALVLAMHEISHNLAFPTPLPNRLLGIFANMATFAPHFSMFQRYHMEHHQYQGHVGVDTDVPTRTEGLIFTNMLLKTLFVILQPAFYIIRPLFVKPKSPGFWDIINWVAVIIVDVIITYNFGVKAAVYLFLSIFLGSGLHPVAGHFIAEHYVFILGQETYSYYGPLNLITFNVGYHNEHHDFPRIPGSRLPKLKKIAPDFYDTLPSYTSWTVVIWRYITDPSVGPFSRVVRKGRAGRETKEEIKDD